MTPRVDITALLAALRARGVEVGVDDHVRCARLLAGAAGLPDDDLRLALRALLARGGAAEDAFDRSWADLATTAPPPETAEATDMRAESRPRRSSRVVFALAVCAMLALAGAGVAAWSPWTDDPRPPARKLTLVPPDAPDAPEPAPLELELDPNLLLPSGRIGTEDEDRRDSTLSIAPPPPWAYWLVPLAGLAVLAALGLAWSLRRARRRPLYGPHTFAPRIESAARERIFARPELERAADALTAPDALEDHSEWDVQRTVDATSRAAGMPVFVPRRADHGLPTLIVLESGPSTLGWRPIVGAMIERLRSLGARIDVADWDGRADRVIEGSRSIAWHEASARVARVIVIAERSPPSEWRSGRGAAPLLWATPSPDHFDDRGFATPEGIARLLRGDDEGSSTGAPLGRSAILRPTSEAGLDELRDHLGEGGWAALALALQWGVPDPVLAVVLARAAGVALGSDEVARMSVLPWMNEGQWPEGLAPAVLARAPADVLERGRRAWRGVLEASEPAAETGAHMAWQLERALADGDRGALRELASAPLADTAEERARELGRSMPRSRRWITSRALGAIGVAAALVAAITIVPPLVQRSRASTPTALADACEGGAGSACLALGVRIARGTDGEIVPERARTLFERACELGDARGCVRAARAHHADGDFDPASRALRAACQAGDSSACEERLCLAVPELRQTQLLSERWEDGEPDLLHEIAWRNARLLDVFAGPPVRDPVLRGATSQLEAHLLAWLARHDEVQSGQRTFANATYWSSWEAGGYLFASDDPDRVPFPEEAAAHVVRYCTVLWTELPPARDEDCAHPSRERGCEGQTWPAWPDGERRRWLGRWQGVDSRFALEMTLTNDGGRLEGGIEWRALGGAGNVQGRTGDTATETVEGTYDADARTIALRGVSVSDDRLLRADQYRFVLGEAGEVTGETLTRAATWEGRLIAWPSDRVPTPLCADIAGTYRLAREETPDVDEGEMLIRGSAAGFVASGADWRGPGRLEGANGRYDWTFDDGRSGRTSIRIGADGRLHGHVLGSGVDWRYIARRAEGPILFRSCAASETAAVSEPSLEVTPAPVAGSPVTITYRNGRSEHGSERPSILVLDERFVMVASLRPGAIVSEPGAFAMQFTFSTAGRYRLQATDSGVRTTTEVDVAGSDALAEISGVQPSRAHEERASPRDGTPIAIAAARPNVTRCYEDQLGSNPDLRGRIAVRFTITARGAVRDAEIVEDTVGNEAVSRCVLRFIRQSRFPPPESGGEVQVTYPYVFAPAD